MSTEMFSYKLWAFHKNDECESTHVNEINENDTLCNLMGIYWFFDGFFDWIFLMGLLMGFLMGYNRLLD